MASTTAAATVVVAGDWRRLLLTDDLVEVVVVEGGGVTPVVVVVVVAAVLSGLIDNNAWVSTGECSNMISKYMCLRERESVKKKKEGKTNPRQGKPRWGITMDDHMW